MARFVVCVLAFLVLWLPGRPGEAMESASVTSTRAAASLISDTDAVAPNAPYRLGLLIRLAPGWHTYWKNPGDAGVPPDLRLTLPPGATTGDIAWPAPRRLTEGSLVTYGYTGQVLLPVTVTPGPGANGIAVTAEASWLVCKDICVPEQGTFRLALRSGPPAPSAEAPLFAAAERHIPRPSPWAAHVAGDGTLWLRGPELSPASIVKAWFIPDAAGTVQDDAPQALHVFEGGFTLGLRPGAAFSPGATLSGVLGVLDRTGDEMDVAVAATPAPVPDGLRAAVAPALWRLLGIAFLAGLILNLMPCVFPVLAMKAVGLAAGAARGRLRAHALSYTAGVLAAFALLGGALMAARAAGGAAGWGFQFQSPVFVALMAWLLFAVGLNLSGAFTLGNGLAGAGQGLAARGGHVGSFFTGLLAVAVATPCTAPFMGAAVAGALTAPAAEGAAVFLAMGLGLAAPYALFALVPGLGRRLPRPGRWMEVLKRVLALPMYAAAAWLVWVLSRETGPIGLAAAIAGLALTAIAAFALGSAQRAPRGSGRLGHLLTGLAGAAALGAVAVVAAAPPPISAAVARGAAEPFSAARLAALRTEGRPVFVDMTAAWCITCQVNERVAIDSSPVQQAFAAHRVAYLKGDWTRQDPAISAFLREHGRDGVPLYLYYPSGGREPVVLPQILTQSAVLNEIGAG